MHILYIHQHFALPTGTTGTRSYEFARRWIKAGHKVTLITGHYDIGGLELNNALIQRQVIDGIEVIVVGTKYSNKQSYLRRMASFLSFTFFSICVGLSIKGVDVVYATSTPLTVGIPAMMVKRLRRKAFVFEVRDQWPEIPIELGIIKSRWFITMLLWLEKTIYQNSSAIVALSPGMAGGIRKVLQADKNIAVVPNSSDIELFSPSIDGSLIRQSHGWNDKLVFLHFGAMGKANGLEFVVQAANRLRENHNIHFVIIGDGSQKAILIDKAERSGLGNVEFLSSKRKSELPAFVAACDVSMVIFSDYPILEHNSANKFFDSLSAGKPILLNYSGWQREILESNKAGFGCRQYGLDEFVEKIVYLDSHRGELPEMGQNARKLAERSFDRNALASQVLSVLQEV